MKKYFIVYTILLAIIITACTTQLKSTLEVSQEIQKYSLEEVSKHNKSDDCWIVINRTVYDVTGFIAAGKHGKAILQGCGIDATELYETRPMGSKTPHSPTARSLLKNYSIGEVAQ